MKQTFTLAFFIFQVMFFGFCLVYLICGPLYLLGFLWKPARSAAAFVFQNIVRYTIIFPLFKRHRANIWLPQQGVLTCSNHRSTLDTYFLLSYCPGVRVISKQTLFYIPFLGCMMKLMGHIPLRSGDAVSYKRAFEQGCEILKAGGHVHVFPEMTRCPKGYEGTQNFHLLPFKMAKDAAAPLVPLIFINTDLAWPKGVWQMDNRVQIQFKALAPLSPNDYASSDELRQITQEKINQALEQNKLFKKGNSEIAL